ncbi:MAG: hypothetical protein IKZ09_07340, partial [Clostridia bacterium]|nr:hypothetical protein [Clostridia bacterium]
LLRRELAFIRSDYRNLIVAYYIENRCVRDIAASMSLSSDAVQQRLHRARIILKEGMNMARTFGKRSYNPDDITFAASGNQPSGLPWTAVERSIPKNILLQASNNPSTAEELSMELGIALPYMEEEIALLVNATLLDKQGDRYLTNFFIMDRDCKTDIYNAIRRDAKERSRLIRELLEAKEAEITALGIQGAHMDAKEMRWCLIPDLIDGLIETTVSGESIYDPPVRANGETWGFVGYEEIDLPEQIIMGHNGSGSGGNMFWTYKYSIDNMWDQCGELEYEEVLLLCDCLRNHRTVDSLTESELYLWKHIDGRYAHADEDGNIIADILVFRGDTLKKLRDLYKQHPAYDVLIQNMQNTCHAVEDILRSRSHKVLHSHLGYYTRMELYAARMMAIHDLLECGYLTLPADAKKSNVGMQLILR